ncbi:hypothetical protein [Alteribacter natronophilus]|uniref:hypothetical protein n=1 Tax=Alteribacter natronophilus TaxID=2583810 RepID=UPI00110D751C|nr:hypothetical protein [Alteribacter natronophilus]TMW70993.1 hypothetical protein FGB90_13545 [Alteribacter natronophilus]
MNKTALLTVTHDPDGRNTGIFNKVRSELEEIYDSLFITVSAETSPLLTEELEDSRFAVRVIPKQGAAHARRQAVDLGLTGKSQYYHYCDFDRILTWATRHPEELKKTVNRIRSDYVILGRTAEAFATHPEEWRETEKITNKVCSIELGKEVDVTAGSCGFSRETAEKLRQYSEAKMTDAEWPMIASRIAGKNVEYLVCEGLEYDPHFNSPNRKTTDSDAWLSRLRLSYIISETACRTGKEHA